METKQQCKSISVTREKCGLARSCTQCRAARSSSRSHVPKTVAEAKLSRGYPYETHPLLNDLATTHDDRVKDKIVNAVANRNSRSQGYPYETL